ncbi:MAG TPA: helix-turn-helix transcriptional regulator [Candidatus Hydrogenedentes bacterium]|nr:helix-turn-helix transcriptional regulator [Candidatus Hydrogenedentota bacterium]
MNAAAFVASGEVRALLERASRAAGTAMSVHDHGEKEDPACIFSHGARVACRYVNALERGHAQCKRNRLKAETNALRRGAVTPFICHMGFACLSAPLLEPEFGMAVTIGPYCPSEGLEALEPDARRGLRAVETHDRVQLPFSLRDIPATSATVFPAILAWMREGLLALRTTVQPAGTPEDTSREDNGAVMERARKPVRQARADPYQAGPIAAALAGGMPGKARELAMAALAESRAPARKRAAAQRARAIALAAAALEASEQAGLACDACWDRFPAFIETVKAAGTDLRLAEAVMELLGALKRETARALPQAPEYAELNRLVIGRLEEGITLDEVAAVLGVHPTAITHRLQRHFGMSFSEYLGRLRVDKAKELLRRTQLSAGDVARRVGIRDVSNFGKLFRKFEGMTPLEYRNQFGSQK